MVCYRRFGHNESDEPAFTQPIMYRNIRSHASAVEIYSKRLVSEGVVTEPEVDAMKAEFRNHLDSELAAADSFRPNKADWLDGRWSNVGFADDEARRGDTGVDIEVLKDVGPPHHDHPDRFQRHKTIQRLLQRRREMVETGEASTGAWPSTWHSARCARKASLFVFRARTASAAPSRSATPFCTTRTASAASRAQVHLCRPGRYEVINSMLSEEAVLAFEYGYTLAEPNALVMWEAQFGDFANGAAGGVRSVHLLLRTQVAAHVGPRLPAAARL